MSINDFFKQNRQEYMLWKRNIKKLLDEWTRGGQLTTIILKIWNHDFEFEWWTVNKWIQTCFGKNVRNYINTPLFIFYYN